MIKQMNIKTKDESQVAANSEVQNILPDLDAFWSANHLAPVRSSQQDGQTRSQEVLITAVNDDGDEYIRVESIGLENKIMAEGDVVVDAVEDFFSELHALVYMVPKEEIPEELVNFTPKLILEENTQVSYEEALFLMAVNLMIQVQANQKDKGGLSYYFHPMSVSKGCVNDYAKIVAVLHDTLEDTPLTAENLEGFGFPEEIIEGVGAVTRKGGETYAAFIERAAKNPLGREVKIADLSDNMDITRLNDLTEKDAHRLRKYLHSFRYLAGVEKDTSMIID